MQFLGDIFNTIFLAPVINLLILILHGLDTIHIPGSLGLSIIILTLLIRVLVWPLITAQLRSAKKMAELKPHLDALKTKHGKDQKAFAAAQGALFKEHGYNPAAGCLPSLVQIPVIIALYQTIQAIFNGPAGLAHINYFLYSQSWRLTTSPDPNFLGFNLAAHPSDFAKYGIYLLLIPVITALFQLFQSKMMTPIPVKTYPSDSLKEKKEKGENEDMMASMQSQMTYMMPIMIGYFAFTFPVGLALYWNVFSIIGIYQQYLVSGWGGAKPWLIKLGIVK